MCVMSILSKVVYRHYSGEVENIYMILPVTAVVRVVQCCRLAVKYRLSLFMNHSQSLVFTALHGMQSRYSDGISLCPSVRLSVCLSNACIVTKRKKAMFRFLHHMKEHLS